MLQKLCNLHELQVSICEIVIPPRINCHADSFSQMSCKVSVFKSPIFNCDILDAKAPSHQSELFFRKEFFFSLSIIFCFKIKQTVNCLGIYVS